MAGIFGFFDYNKFGPGVPEDASPKPRIQVFFEIYLRKFWRLGALNLLFFLFNLPALILSVALVSNIFLANGFSANSLNDAGFRIILGCIFVCFPVVTFGPAQAGFTYVLRNYAREEHAWILSDFKDQALANFKQSMIVSIIDFIVVILFGIAINSYMQMGNNIYILAGNTLVIMSLVIFVMMHMYIYPIMVTFKLSIWNIYKNSFIFVMMKLFSTIGIFLICLLLIALPMMINFGLLLFPLITISTIGLITNFYVYPTIKKNMIDAVKINLDKE